MPGQLDVYRDWLGIAEAARPLDYYQLLRLKRFTDDRQKIRSHYQKMNAHVRKFATGDFAAESQELMNELARAMLCLTDVLRKGEYDASLGRKDIAASRQRTLEEILLAIKTIDRAQLDKARSYADAVGLEVRDALVQQKMAAADVVMLAYAESLGLPYIELEDVGVDEALVPRVPPTLARQHSCVPVMTDEGQLLMASPNPLVPDVEEELRLRFDMPVRTVLCTPASINAVVAQYYPRDAAAVAPAAAAPKRPAAQKAARPEPGAQPRTRDEQVKRRGMCAVIAFNLTAIVSALFYAYVLGGMIAVFSLPFFAIIILALVAAIAAFAIMTMKDL